jgi:transcriptional regulator GlxA family with amidase domain
VRLCITNSLSIVTLKCPRPPEGGHYLKTDFHFHLFVMATSLRVGVLLVPPVQFLDTSVIDPFGMLTPEYLDVCGLPEPLTKLAIPVSIYYIAASGPGTSAPMTSGASLAVTHSVSAPEVQPGQLDVLIVPGPDPNVVPEGEVLAFVRKHKEVNQTDFLVICTGSFVAGYAGLLDGKTVTGPRGLLDRLRKKYPAAKFVERRWERDGRVWTSGIPNLTTPCCRLLPMFFGELLTEA